MKRKLLQKIREWLFCIIHLLTTCLRKLNGTHKFDNKQGLQDFAPKRLRGNQDKYSESLKYSIDNPNIKNVALSGAYGSGKSSIIKTFEYKYPQYKCLNISLATFDENVHNDKEIEFCILKQLFYKVEQNKIPESRFKRIENHKYIGWKAFAFLLWITSLVHYLEIKSLNKLIEIFNVDFYSKPATIVYFLYLIGGVAFLLYKVMGFVLNFKLTKLSFQSAEIENGDTKKSKDFENEIDEILYFFERNNIDVVFLEDLDRFGNSNIFIKLREINFLINNYEPIKKDRKVTFVYAVQDDTFKKDERTKFFDFIIPVIPVINYSNSGTELLNKIDIKADKIEKSFIDEVSLYLTDKRTLISIVNEYKIYKKIIGKDLDNRKLLAMMIYKNIEPTDFDSLNKQKGYVYCAFTKSYDLIKDIINAFDKQRDALQIELEKINAENLENVKELRNLYILEFYKKVSPTQQIHSFYINNSSCSADKVTTDSNFEEFSKSTNIKFYYNYANVTNHGISFKQLEDVIGDYGSRLEVIKNKKSSYLNEIKLKIEYFKTEKQSIKSKNLSQLIKEYNSMDYFSGIITTDPLQNQNLVNYLLRYGHLDESYLHYISHFYAGSISKNDYDFLLCFTNGSVLPFSHKLEELDGLFLKLKDIPDYFDRVQILNFSLLDYLIKNRLKKTNSELQRVLKLLIINAPHQFIDDYINYTEEKNIRDFIIELNSQWNTYSESGFWSEISPVFTLEKLKFYLNLMFSCADNKKVAEFINRFDVEQLTPIFLSKLEDITYFEGNKSKLMEFISTVSIKFENLTEISNKELSDFIYNNSYYQINDKMIELFLNRYAKNAIDFELLKTANYTTIKNSGASKLIQYVNLNIEFYIKTIFLKLENNCNESEEVIIDLLNDNYEVLELELLIEIINKNQTTIRDISKINEINLWTELLQDDKIAVTWENLLYYYKEKKEYDVTLKDYLNNEKHYDKLSKTKINKNFDEENSPFVKDFLIALFTSDLKTESFAKLISSSPYFYEGIEKFKTISNDKMKLLIQNRTVRLNKTVCKSISESFPELLISLLEKNKDEFINSVGDYTLDSSIIIKLIDSEIFDSKQKMEIIDNTPESILMANQSIARKVSHLLSQNPKTQVSIELLKVLLTQSQSIEDKVKLFNLYYIDYDESELENIIELLGEPYSKITKGKRPQFNNNSYNLDFVTKMRGVFIRNSEIVDNNRFIQTSSKKVSKI
ncbi:YobI family P-loop NTPase [Flavobacterium taihuense]|uniref:YobI-like P-loop NTPase domain-containing protein n=1 Tax=Flavobacterium taihuense TaxID=2857508 RepID=A0ABS6XRS1_9FLAO|nr:hypothetical protein [Flavobacterium taihuense]MBW4359365.1 hypothetical protein [Flavobacterium taihuense]